MQLRNRPNDDFSIFTPSGDEFAVWRKSYGVNVVRSLKRLNVLPGCSVPKPHSVVPSTTRKIVTYWRPVQSPDVAFMTQQISYRLLPGDIPKFHAFLNRTRSKYLAIWRPSERKDEVGVVI